MSEITLQVYGLKELQAKLSPELYEEAVEEQLDTFTKRFMRRSKGKAAKANVLSLERVTMSRRVTTPLAERWVPRAPVTAQNNPRTSGRTWREYITYAAFPSMAKYAANAIKKKMIAKWKAANP